MILEVFQPSKDGFKGRLQEFFFFFWQILSEIQVPRARNKSTRGTDDKGPRKASPPPYCLVFPLEMVTLVCAGARLGLCRPPTAPPAGPAVLSATDSRQKVNVFLLSPRGFLFPLLVSAENPPLLQTHN